MGQTADELRSQISEQRDDVGRDLEAIGDRVSPSRMVSRRRERVRRAWHDTRDRVMGSADALPSSAGHAGRGAMDSAQSAVGAVKESAMALPERTRERAQGAPIVAVGVAFGAGFLLAAVLPETKAEHELAERFDEQLGQGAARLRDGVSEAVHEVADNVSGEVQEAGRTVADSARHAADHVKDVASS